MAATHCQGIQGRLLTYLRRRLEGIVVRYTAALNLTIGQHLTSIFQFHGRDLILIREKIAKKTMKCEIAMC